MNMKRVGGEIRIADYFKILGSPFRIQILYNIGYGEACVCHLVAVLNKRQAYISQHLMVMRDAGILETRREGKYIYYRVADRSLFEILESTAGIINIPENGLPNISNAERHSQCDCPHCLPEPITIK
jgi:DNA-binding transcriptional ArsR family regulator